MVAPSLSSLIMSIIGLGFAGLVIAAVVLFIKDGIDSKREGRKRKTVFTVLFIVAMGILALIVITMVLLALLITAFMKSM